MSRAWRSPGSGRDRLDLADVPVDTPNSRAGEASFREIGRVLTARGVPASAITLHKYHPDDPRTFATIRFSYPKISAVAGPCGLWPEDLGPSIHDYGYNENKPYYNFGCATQRNLAAMIDNPADLEQPRPESPAYTRDVRSVREVPQGRSDDHHLSRSRQGQTQRHRQMSSDARHNSEEQSDVTPPRADDYIAPAPRVSVQAFCETVATAAAARAASEDRRLAKAHLSVHMGGIAAGDRGLSYGPDP